MARLADLTVFVSEKNKALIARFLSHEACKLYVVHDIASFEVKDKIARAHVYVDPLNGLEPEDIPTSVYSIAVLHDFMFLDAPYFFTNEELRYRALNYGNSISRADLVLTVSAQQAEKIRHFYGKIDVEWIAQFPYFRFGSDSNIVKSAATRYLLYPGVQ